MSYNQKVIRNGRITMGLAIIANFIPAIYVGLRYDVMPSWGLIFQIWGIVAASYGISWIVQPIAYYPTMGAAGSYIGWLAGSCGDIRMPAASMAQKVAGVEPGTHEGDVVGTIGVSCSVLVSASLITIFVLIGTQVIPLLPAFVTSSFSYILPALFGAIFVDQARKSLKSGLLTLACGLAILFFGSKLGINGGILTLVVIICGILISRMFFVADKKKAAQAAGASGKED